MKNKKIQRNIRIRLSVEDCKLIEELLWKNTDLFNEHHANLWHKFRATSTKPTNK